MGAIQFIENLDRTVLTISDQDFEKHVEASVSAIAERDSHDDLPVDSKLTKASGGRASLSDMRETPRFSDEIETQPDSSFQSGSSNIGAGNDEKAAVGMLFRTIKKPLSSIGRIFSEDVAPSQPDVGPVETPRRLSPAVFKPPGNNSDIKTKSSQGKVGSGPVVSAEDAAARQASAEAAEAQRIQIAEHQGVVE